ncbi:MAG: signal peptidase II [Rickettsiales bacterium]|jgi:signal peptidase II|nr:signal peptidase II [Rickettsiales bacterium]
MNFWHGTRERKRFFIYLLIAGIVFAADQTSKNAILDAINGTIVKSYGTKKEIHVFGFLNLVLLWNRGGCFGLMSNVKFISILLLTIALATAMFLLVLLWKHSDTWDGICFSLILGGTLGNVRDRISHGAVIDFIDFHILQHHWPSFNVADSAIFIGVLLYMLNDLFDRKNRFEKS